MKNYHDVPDFASLSLPAALVRDLRSDHAGEWGAVEIYRGILATSRSASVRSFANHHRETELRHRRFFDAWLPAEHHSKLLPLWRAAGWALGAVAGLFGERSVYHTIEAVETFVERHYLHQIEALADVRGADALREQLIDFCADEVSHRDDAREHVANTRGLVSAAWSRIVGAGSAVGVSIARLV